MKSIENDSCYYNLVDNILENVEFNKLKDIEHHGITRYIHSIRVSHCSYKIAKKLGLDYVEIARAGLLHDFFTSELGRTSQEKLVSTFNHPKIAAKNAEEIFGISNKEKNMIESHMFPFCITLPKYSESWIVILSDKIIGSYEMLSYAFSKMSYAMNLACLLMFSIIK